MTNDIELTPEEQEVVRALQQELPLVSDPYKVIAGNIGMTEDRLMDIIKSLRGRGCLKRISIALRHNNVGFKINVMAVWNIDPNIVDNVGQKLVKKSYITHCYRRKVVESFPYNLYTMLHARSEEEFHHMVEEIIQTVEEETYRPADYLLLRSVSELKKTGMKYFIEGPGEIKYDHES